MYFSFRILFQHVLLFVFNISKSFFLFSFLMKHQQIFICAGTMGRKSVAKDYLITTIYRVLSTGILRLIVKPLGHLQQSFIFISIFISKITLFNNSLFFFLNNHSNSTLYLYLYSIKNYFFIITSHQK